MNYVITIALTVISGALLYIVQNLIKENDKLRNERKHTEQQRSKAISDGVLSLLKIQLIEYHDKYMVGGHIPAYVYENWDAMYKSYEALGGNGMVQHMNSEINELRINRGNYDKN